MNLETFDGIFVLKLVAVLGMLGTIIYGSSGVFSRLKEKKAGFGPSSLQAFAITIFLPAVVIVALLTNLDTQAIAALLGTIAGYVLSSPKKDPPQPPQA
jgi:hypothetical protein